MAFNEKEKQILEWAKTNNKSREEVSAEIFKFRQTGKSSTERGGLETKIEPTFTERAGAKIEEAGRGVQEAIGFQGQAPLRRGVEATAEAFGAVPAVAIEALPETARTGLQKAGEFIGKGIDWLADKLGSTQLAQDFVQKHPEATRTIEEALGTAQAGGEIAGTILGAGGVKLGAGKGVELTQRAGADLSTKAIKATEGVANISEDLFKKATDLKSRTQLVVASKAVSPQLKESVNRLFAKGTERLDSPVATYDKFLAQSKKALTDIKIDPAISVVGEEIGNNFSKVVKMRQAVGKVMSEELKKVGDIKTNILGSVDDFVKNLGESGVVYDRLTRKVNTKLSQTKFTQPEIKLIENYSQQLQALGSKPTIAQIDAFLSRISSELSIYKSANNIIGTTNAERIIKGSLSKLREQFDPIKSGNKQLTKYSNARKSYSELSNFIEDGVPFLGKVTQSGDFARDASLAKSSVQSVLNNGKKDWLGQLEALTGYQALDKSVLALQAMKDAGDFRGLSLLEKMSEGSLPVSKLGVVDKIIKYATEKGADVVVGSTEEQTRAFLNSLKKGK